MMFATQPDIIQIMWLAEFVANGGEERHCEEEKFLLQ